MPLATGTATAIGSLPHIDPTRAATFIIEHHPGMPAAPSLPSRHPAEGMLAQAAWGIDGVSVGDDGRIVVPRPRSLDADAPLADPDLDGEPWVSLHAFLAAARRLGPRQPVKLQLTGPVTLGVALLDAGVSGPRAFAVAGAAVRARLRHLVDAVSHALTGAPLVVFIDEPWFGLVGGEGFPLHPRAATDLLESTLRAAGPGVTTGVHCCAQADWAAILGAGPDVLSLPVDVADRLRPGDVRPFLDDGGWLAWGAVPTTGPLPGGTAGLWPRLAERWHDLVIGGCDPVLVRTRALVTPACGLAGHSEASAARVLDLAVELGGRVAEGAVTGRR